MYVLVWCVYARALIFCEGSGHQTIYVYYVWSLWLLHTVGYLKYHVLLSYILATQLYSVQPLYRIAIVLVPVYTFLALHT